MTEISCEALIHESLGMTSDVSKITGRYFIDLLEFAVVPGFLYGFQQPALRLVLDFWGESDAFTDWTQRWCGLPKRLASQKNVLVDMQGQVVDSPLVSCFSEGLHRLQLSSGLCETGMRAVLEVSSVLPTPEPKTKPPSSPGLHVSFVVQHAEPAQMAKLLPTWVDAINRVGRDGRVSPSAWEAVQQDCVAQLSQRVPEGTNHRHILREAAAMGIPMIALPGRVHQLGWGKKSRLFNSTLSDSTTAIATAWAKDKRATHHLLRMGGLPVPAQVPVASLDEALWAAKRLAYPVVLKPAMLDQGLGVEAGLRDEQALRDAFPRSSMHSSHLLIEKHFDGEDYRVYVIQGKMVAAAHRSPAQVVGDGVSSVAALVEQENLKRSTPSSGASVYKRIELDAEALNLLAQSGLEPLSVPVSGDRIRLRRSANSSRGGLSVDITSQVHPDNKILCERAAALLRLDIAGLDLLIPDISRSWREVGAVFCEVNAQPQMGGAQPWIFRAMLGQYVQGQGRIPIVLVLGNLASLASSQAIAVALQSPGRHVLFSGGAGAHVFNKGRAALMDPRADLVVLTTDGQGLEKYGLPVDVFDVLVITSGWLVHGDVAAVLRRLVLQFSGAIFLDPDIPQDADVVNICQSLFGAQRVVHCAQNEHLAMVVKNAMNKALIF